VGYIDVYRNGVRLGAADYTASNGTTVVLAVGALSGDLITTESFYVSSVLNAIPATAGAVNTTYIVDSAVTTAKIADSNVTTAKIADANVTTAKIADANVTTAKIANASVTQAKIASGVAGTGPAFSAYASGSTTLSNPGVVKVAFATEEYDTNSNYDTTNSRFTPTVAGYYQVNSTVHTNNNARLVAIVYKNGAQAYQGLDSSGSTLFSSTVSALVYCNGSTDYIEIWCFNSGTANTTQTGAPNTFFQAVLVRGA
jgi:hypothetical protein